MRTDSGTEASGIITRYDNKYRTLAVFTWTFHKFDMCNSKLKYYWIRKCKKWFTLLASVAPLYILLGKGLLYFAKWYFTKRNEICTLRNGNLYFAKWKCGQSVLCEMGICTSRNYMYFAKWIAVLCETNSGTFLKRFLRRSLCEPTILLQSWPRHTFFFVAAA